jgi:Sugar phosphate isomerases/epimerases
VTAQVALSTAAAYPEPTRAAFELAAELGYDGVELMVWADAASQEVASVERLSRTYGVPVLAVHAPCLLVTQRVWTPDPVLRLRRSIEMASIVGARTVVIHPPFRWQRRYADAFPDEVAAGRDSGVAVAVENMYPVVRGRVRSVPYTPGFDPTETGYEHYTLDLSHTAASGQDALALLDRMGSGLAHVHLADGSGRPRDEHLVPGRGSQPCAEVCSRLAEQDWSGTVVLEVSTRRCRTRYERAEVLAESLLFARLHLTRSDGQGVDNVTSSSADRG